MRWKSCIKDPPKQFLRIEIKDKQKRHYIGYRFGHLYFETYGNYIIKEPMYWRLPPNGSELIKELREKIHTLVGGDKIYG